MARARNIKPGFFKNEDLAECSVWARLLFPGLWMLADRDGRLEDRPKRIKGELFPFDTVDVEPLLQELSHWNFITRYVADERRCIEIKNFSIHQSPHGTEKDSDLPDQQGRYLVNERNPKNDCVTGKTWYRQPANAQNTVSPPLANSEPTVSPPLANVDPPCHNALNPESLNPESFIPEEEKSSSYPQATYPQAPHQAEVLLLVEKNNFLDTDPKHPRLRGLLERGATVQDFAHAVPIAKAAGKGFAYLLGVVEGKMSDEIARQSRPKTRDSPGIPSVHDPESRASIEDLGIAQGLGRWNELTEHWSAYKARVLGRSEPPPPVASNVARLVQTAFKRRA